MYNVWKVGTFNCPPGTQVNQYFLDNLMNTFVYRCDEMVFEHLPVVQLMKYLLEGSKILNTDIKYKVKQHIEAVPVFINVNVSSLPSTFKWGHEEEPAFETTCLFLKMKLALKHRVKETEFQFLGDSGHELIYFNKMLIKFMRNYYGYSNRL